MRQRFFSGRKCCSVPSSQTTTEWPVRSWCSIHYNLLQEQPRPYCENKWDTIQNREIRFLGDVVGLIIFINGSPDPLPENFIDGSPDPLPENFHRCFSRPVAGSSISIDGSPDPLGKQIIDAPFAPRAQRTLAKFDFCRAGTFHLCFWYFAR